MTVEHRVLQSADPGRAAVYENLVYACTYCNGARQRQPLNENGVELLNPASAYWSGHFRLGGEYQLLPEDGDEAAERTADVYDVNEPCRREIRRTRDERLRHCLDQIHEIPPFLAWIHGEMRDSTPPSVEQLRLARLLRQDLRNAYRELSRHRAFPEDRPERCACPKRRTFNLPPGLQKQLIHLADPAWTRGE